jgi:hypothetical protein
MRKRILVPRKDHEVYFIPLPREIKNKNRAKYVEGRLEELHPAFSPSCAYDIQKFIINEKCWLMITVMNYELLTEYRLLNRGARFYTPTSLIIRRKDITQEEPRQFADEIIGYRKENDEPVSEPLKSVSNTEPENRKLLETALKNASGHQSVFRKRIKPVIFLFPLFFVLIGSSLFLLMSQYQRNSAERIIPVIEENPAVIFMIPSPTEMLAIIAGTILETGGMIINWEYDENAEPSFRIMVEGSEPFTAAEHIYRTDYIKTCTIGEVRYINGKPRYTMMLSINRSKYTLPGHEAFISQHAMLSLLSKLRLNLFSLQANMVSEVLPETQAMCSITLNCAGKIIVGVLETLEKTLKEEKTGIQNLSIAYDRDQDSFIIGAVFSPVISRDNFNEDAGFQVIYENSKENISTAFGYAELLITPVIIEEEKIIIEEEEEPVKLPEYYKIGIIGSENGKATAYYRNEQGKIIIKEE